MKQVRVRNPVLRKRKSTGGKRSGAWLPFWAVRGELYYWGKAALYIGGAAAEITAVTTAAVISITCTAANRGTVTTAHIQDGLVFIHSLITVATGLQLPTRAGGSGKDPAATAIFPSDPFRDYLWLTSF